jgi:hypothetical protein
VQTGVLKKKIVMFQVIKRRRRRRRRTTISLQQLKQVKSHSKASVQ